MADLKNVLDNEGLAYFWSKLKKRFAALKAVSDTAYPASSTDGDNYYIDAPDIGDIYVGKLIRVIPNIVSTTTKPHIYVNGIKSRIYMNSATTGSFFNGTRSDFIGAGKPLELMFIGAVDSAGNTGWRCMNAVRVNLEALTSNGESTFKSIPTAPGVANEKPIWKTPSEVGADINMDSVFYATSTDGITYTAAIPNVSELYAGLKITIIPKQVSKSTLPKLNINGLGAKNMYCKASGRTGGYLQSTNENVLAANVPVELIYTGNHWKIDLTRPSAENLYGAVSVKNGGTGRETLTSGYYLVGNGTGAVQLKSRAQVLNDIGAVSLDAFNALLARVEALESGGGGNVTFTYDTGDE
jgi:hypothetical protein